MNHPHFVTTLPSLDRRPPAKVAAVALALSALWGGATLAAPTGAYTGHFVTGAAGGLAPGDGRNSEYQCNELGPINALGGCSINSGRVTEGGATVYGGTVGGSGALTGFVAETRANGFHYEYPDNVPTVVVEPAFSQARAAADLATGTLRASVSNSAEGLTAGGFVAGYARADMHDIVQLQVAGAQADTLTRVRFQFAVDGTFFNNGQTTVFGEPGSGNLQTYLRLDDRSSAHEGTPDYWLAAFGEWTNFRGVFQSNNQGLDIRGARVGGSWTSFSVESMVFEGWFDILGTSATLNPTLGLSVSCSLGLQCDYGNTARFSFVELPTGVSYTSASGVFLTAAVPEPGAWAMMLAGMGSLLMLARRRRLPTSR